MSFLRDILTDASMNESQCSDLFKVTMRTIKLWEKNGPPEYAIERLSLRTGRHPHWPGFRILDGAIRCPNHDLVGMQQVGLYHWAAEHLIREVKKNEELERRLDEIHSLGKAANQTQDSNFIELIKLVSA